MTRFHFLDLSALLLGAFVLLTGCGKNAPDGFPKTYPATMTILHGGQPYVDAKVFLHPAQGTTVWSVGGDANGGGRFRFTTVQGSHSVPGIPAGEYIVTIDYFKLTDVALPENYDDLSAEERMKAMAAVEKSETETRAGSKVPAKLSLPDSSPIRWTINASDANELTVKLDDY